MRQISELPVTSHIAHRRLISPEIRRRVSPTTLPYHQENNNKLVGIIQTPNPLQT